MRCGKLYCITSSITDRASSKFLSNLRLILCILHSICSHSMHSTLRSDMLTISSISLWLDEIIAIIEVLVRPPNNSCGICVNFMVWYLQGAYVNRLAHVYVLSCAFQRDKTKTICFMKILDHSMRMRGVYVPMKL
uniref:Uncharacterized protein n=1 Tax=Glossina morsitans morsitans TaxID=37546 RepID=A0A1B0FB65_GLOMM